MDEWLMKTPTELEVHHTIIGMKSGIVLGQYGITDDFYKHIDQ